MQWPFPLPSWVPSWLPGGSPPTPFPREDVRSNIDRARELAERYGVTLVTLGALPAGDSGKTISQAARTETISEFERLIRMTDFERLLERTVFTLPDRPRSDRDPTPPQRNPVKRPAPGGPIKDFDFDLPPPPKAPPRVPGGPIKDFPSSVPNLPGPAPGGSGAGGGGVGSVLGGLLQLPVVRAAGRALEAVGPVLDVATIWREYLTYPEQLQRQVDEARRRTRRTGPTRRAGPRTRTQSQTVTPAMRTTPAPRSGRTAPRPSVSEVWQPMPGEVPDFTRPPGPVATRRDTSRQPATERAPVQMPGWQWLSQPGLQAGVRRAVETLAGPAPGGQSPLSFLAGQSPGGRATPEPSPAPRGTAAARTSPDAVSVPRCPSSDPCMRRAADKRREQRKRAKECANKVKVQREVTICQQSK